MPQHIDLLELFARSVADVANDIVVEAADGVSAYGSLTNGEPLGMRSVRYLARQ